MVYVSQTAAGEAKEVSALFAVKDGARHHRTVVHSSPVAHGTGGLLPAVASQRSPSGWARTATSGGTSTHRTVGRAGYAVVMSDYGKPRYPRCVRLHREERAGVDVPICRSRAALKLDVRDIDANKVAIVGHSQGRVQRAGRRSDGSRATPPELPIKGDRGPGAGLFRLRR